MENMNRMVRNCPGRARRGACIAILALLGAWFSGCQEPEATIQAAFYTDQDRHFPRKGLETDIGFVFKEVEREYLNVEWQDVKVFRISVPQVGPFQVRLEDLTDPNHGVDPNRATTFPARDSEWAGADLKNVGKVSVKLSRSSRGKAVLDNLAIDFTPECLARLGGMVAAPPARESTKAGDYRCFLRRAYEFPETGVVERTPDGNGYYLYTPAQGAESSREPNIALLVKVEKTLKQVRHRAYTPVWEYWPADPRSTVPVRPAKTNAMPRKTLDETIPGELREPLRIAVEEPVQVVFKAGEGGKLPDYLKPLELKTDDQGRVSLDLLPYGKAADDCDELTIQISSPRDSSGRPFVRKLSKADLNTLKKLLQASQSQPAKANQP
jgi:hypothetical protein